MKLIRATLIAAALITLATAQASERKSLSHVTREVAIQLLRQEGILHGKTRVVSAKWGDDTHEWLITLRHPGGLLSAWFVDATGGTIMADRANIEMQRRARSNQAMERTAGSFGSSLSMKFHPQAAATRHPASCLSSCSR
jgi:hypothetical protein